MLVLISFACHCYLRASLFFFCFGGVFLGKLSFWLASHLCYTLLLRLTYLTLPYFSFITCNSELLTAIYFSRNSLMSSFHAFLSTCHLVLGNIAHIQLVLSLITPPRSVLKKQHRRWICSTGFSFFFQFQKIEFLPWYVGILKQNRCGFYYDLLIPWKHLGSRSISWVI